MRSINQNNSVILEGKERELAISKIHLMLSMTGDCNQVNKLIDGTGTKPAIEIRKATWEDVDNLDYGYIVCTECPDVLEAHLNQQDSDIYTNSVTVYMLDADGSSAVTYDMLSGEAKLLLGDLNTFSKTVEDYTLAW